MRIDYEHYEPNGKHSIAADVFAAFILQVCVPGNSPDM